MIDGYAASGNTAAIQQYCLNEQVNLVLSSNVRKALKHKIDIKVHADVPEKLEDSRALDICILLANALENSISAVALVPVPYIELNVGSVGSKVVIELKNSFQGHIRFENSLPKSCLADNIFTMNAVI